MTPPIFVIGAPRSGTTYLARALGLAEDAAYWEESELFSLYGPRRFPRFFAHAMRGSAEPTFSTWSQAASRCADAVRGIDRLERMVERMLRHTKLGPYDLQPSNPLVEVQQCALSAEDSRQRRDLLRRYRELEREGFAGVCEALLADFVQCRGKQHVIEKTPDHLVMTPVIRTVFPAAKFVLIRRDKREALASCIRTFRLRRTLRTAWMTDRVMLKRLSRQYRAYGRIEESLKDQPWCRCVSYAEMVGNPHETVSSALDWLGLTLDDRKHGHLFQGRPATSQWDRLTSEEKSIVECVFGTAE